MKIIIINGPNLNLTGIRQQKIYGYTSFKNYLEILRKQYQSLNLAYFQSNIEGGLIEKLHEVGFSYDGVVLNAGGYSHTSVALIDAVSAITTPVIEVHLSNIYARENFRQKSLLSPYSTGIIIGFGLESYTLAVQYFFKQQKSAMLS